MREILFRGKDIKGNWHIGLLAHIGNAWYISNGAGVSTAFEVIPETVGQYTGLTDKNGKKIFEGDIVDASNSWWDACGPAGHDSPIMKVEWSDKNCGFDPFANYDCDCGVYIHPSQVETIGNIHDNPELLKEGVE